LDNIFMREEKKYIISGGQAAVLQKHLAQRMTVDRFGEYLVQNVYFDTDNFDIISESMEKPLYKEKLRLRFYNQYNPESKGYLELKKKFDGIVYKRRIAFPLSRLKSKGITDILSILSADDSQISREIYYFTRINAVCEKIHVEYKRIAYNDMEDNNLRVTFDRDIFYHLIPANHLSFNKNRRVLNQDQMVLEIKTPGAIPLWLAGLLSELEIFPVSFSKVGACYVQMVSGAQRSSKYHGLKEEKENAA